MSCFRNFNQQVPFAEIDHSVEFYEGRPFGRREIAAGKFPFFIIAFSIPAGYGKQSFQVNRLHLFAGRAVSVDGHGIERVPVVTSHQAGVGVVGHGAEQGPYHAFVDGEAAVGFDAVSEHDGDAASAHFDMVVMGQALFGVPDDAAVIGQLPAELRVGCRKRQKGECAAG